LKIKRFYWSTLIYLQGEENDYKKIINNLINSSDVRYIFVLQKLVIDFNAARYQQSSETNTLLHDLLIRGSLV